MDKRHAKMAAAATLDPNAVGPAKLKKKNGKSKRSPSTTERSESGSSTPELDDTNAFPDLSVSADTEGIQQDIIPPVNPKHQDDGTEPPKSFAEAAAQESSSTGEAKGNNDAPVVDLDNTEEFPPVEVNHDEGAADFPNPENVSPIVPAVDPKDLPEPVDFPVSFAEVAREENEGEAPSEPAAPGAEALKTTITDVDDIEAGAMPSFADVTKDPEAVAKAEAKTEEDVPTSTTTPADPSVSAKPSVSSQARPADDHPRQQQPTPRTEDAVEEVKRQAKPVAEAAAAKANELKQDAEETAAAAKDTLEAKAKPLTDEVKAKVASKAEPVLNNAAESVRSTAHQAKQTATNAATSVQQSAAQAAHTAKQTAAQATASAQKAASQAANAIHETVTEIVEEFEIITAPSDSEEYNDDDIQNNDGAADSNPRRRRGCSRRSSSRDGTVSPFCPHRIIQHGWILGALGSLLSALLWKRNPSAARAAGVFGIGMTLMMGLQWTLRKISGR
ncbi:hypothetical protein IWQ60_001228 [Tieghemiomyces parasiticus]|uniref:Uncharacterized protein n=1 Tax=Tieghemiomyces parasiticus TaxID=78921 RepID=A0A9W8E225_9FUNG|nr:hypothetical protein IWQ60_001228 [Tieghemiomyces parasiticus]